MSDGKEKKSFWQKIKDEVLEDDSKKEINPDQPLSKQIDEGTKVAPVLMNNPIYAGNAASNFGVQMPGISEEERQKMEQYISNVFNALNDPKPSYHEFIAMTDAFVGVPAQQTFGPTFQGFKLQGLTKDVLLQTAEDSLKALQNNAVEFQQEINNKIENKVTKLRNEAMELQEQIAKIQEQIQAKIAEAQANELKYQNSLNAYNVVSQNYLAKITNDITNIKTFVQ